LPLGNSVITSALFLLVLRVLANDHYFAFSFDYLALFADRLY
jgi:hypothetical protein